MKQENWDKIKQGITYQDLLSICIGKSLANQQKFQEFLGRYTRWDTDVTQGVLVIDERIFEVEYIGTTSKEDQYWFTAEQEQMIPDEGVRLMLQIREKLKQKEIPEYYFPKVKLTKDINEHNLGMIFCALAPKKVCYFNGNGEVSIVMFVKNLPETIFEPINANQFFQIIIHIVQNFDINVKLMIESFLIENETLWEEKEQKITAYFDQEERLEFEFKDGKLIHIDGNLNAKEEEK